MNPRVSIIVAVYNAEKTLPRCLDSLINQTLKEIEILLVNDGSTDASADICASYARNDSRIRCLNKRNGGVSAARNYGLDHATGDYVIFLDSDDFVDVCMYGSLYAKAKESNADVVCCDFWKISVKERVLVRHRNASFRHTEFLNEMIDKLFGSVCNRMIKRELFDRYHVRFDASIDYGEDKLVLVTLLHRSLQAGEYLHIEYVPKGLLYYDNTGQTSLMKRSAKDRLSSQLRLWQAMGPQIDVKTNGRAYYSLLTRYGFQAFWNNILSPEDYVATFSHHKGAIKEYAPCSSMKLLVLLAASGKWTLAKKIKWVSVGRILADKWSK